MVYEVVVRCGGPPGYHRGDTPGGESVASAPTPRGLGPGRRMTEVAAARLPRETPGRRRRGVGGGRDTQTPTRGRPMTTYQAAHTAITAPPKSIGTAYILGAFLRSEERRVGRV